MKSRVIATARRAFRFLRKELFAYTPLIEVRISRDAILHNFNVFKSLSEGVLVAPVLKSNAYGHGLVEVARILDAERPPFFCVDSFFEALILRNEGIRSPILIIGYTPIENISRHTLERVAFGILSLDDLKRVAHQVRSRTLIHLKFDTGMHRHGIPLEKLDEAVHIVRSNPHLVLEGVYSHLADADTADSSLTRSQIQEWNKAVKAIRSAIPSVRYFHLSATTGSAYASKIDANVMRVGIGLYGINFGLKKLDVHPALEMRTRITSLRTVRKGEAIGYNATHVAKHDLRVASIPVGYAEGVDRRLSDAGVVSVRGVLCPILGRVSMNITSIDATNVSEVALDDDVVVISKNPGDPHSLAGIAERCDTIPYEIMVHIPSQLRRVIV